MKERINQVMKIEGLSSSKFAEEIGIQRAAMSHILNERNKPSADVLIKILTRFKDIDPGWLLLGTGQMKQNTFGHPQMKPPDLFTNVTLDKSEIPKAPASRKEPVSETESKNTTLPKDLPPTVAAETHSRKISQIMIFFSDHTYEIFRPEKDDSRIQ
jgi:transcriptional regulator with XRE-family HTH domain